MVLVEGEETAVEHPVDRTARGEPVADTVGPTPGHRPDVSRLPLGSPSPVAEEQTRHGTALAVGGQDTTREGPVPEGPPDEGLDHGPVEGREGLRQTGPGGGSRSRRDRFLPHLPQTETDDELVFVLLEEADGPAEEAAIGRSVRFPEAPFKMTTVAAEGHGPGELETGDGIDPGIVVPRTSWILFDPLDPGRCEIDLATTSPFALSRATRFVIDDEIPDDPLDGTQIGARKWYWISGMSS